MCCHTETPESYEDRQHCAKKSVVGWRVTNIHRSTRLVILGSIRLGVQRQYIHFTDIIYVCFPDRIGSVQLCLAYSLNEPFWASYFTVADIWLWGKHGPTTLTRSVLGRSDNGYERRRKQGVQGDDTRDHKSSVMSPMLNKLQGKMKVQQQLPQSLI